MRLKRARAGDTALKRPAGAAVASDSDDDNDAAALLGEVFGSQSELESDGKVKKKR